MSEIADLKKCLRLKSNLAAFVNAVGADAGIGNFRIESDRKMTGGEVHVAIGSLGNQLKRINSLLSRNRAVGVENVDHLFCVNQNQVYSEGRPTSIGVGRCAKGNRLLSL